MADVYKSLCRELDLLLIEILDDMEQHITSKLDLEKSMNDGFVNIAKTRYINGRSSVTSLQLPTEFSNPIQPQARVIRTPDSVQITNDLTSIKRPDLEKEGLRKRDREIQEDGQKTTDPIRLFGVLVPQSLKNAQKSFITSLDKVGSVACGELELNKKLSRYEKLLKIQKQLTI